MTGGDRVRGEDFHLYSLLAQVGQTSEKVKSSRQVTCRVKWRAGQGSHLMCCQAEVIRPPVVWQPCRALVAYLGPGKNKKVFRNCTGVGELTLWEQDGEAHSPHLAAYHILLSVQQLHYF